MARRWSEQEVEKEAEREAGNKEREGGEEEAGKPTNSDNEFCPTITFTKERIQVLSAPWWGSLIIKIVGLRVSFHFLQARLRSMWRPKGKLKVITLDEDLFLIKFGDWNDRERVLNEGTWAIYGHYLSVRKWAPNFDPMTEAISCAVVWARIQNLPLEIYNEEALKIIGDKLGKFLKMDGDTAAREKARYARICVEVNLSKSLIGVFTINGRTFKVEYEGLGLICFGCGRVGHRKEGCPTRKKMNYVGEERETPGEARVLSTEAGKETQKEANTTKQGKN